tara:strand:+ start:1828 stop:3093 length:1266 start_codon:yes stop_codon:yes gene_type:complete
MEIDDNNSPEGADFSPAVPLEISQETAERADELLREFAEDACLETALIVDQSGALVTGISSEADVTVEVISALVAGASGAMKALVRELGETGEIESLHQGSDRTVYLREIVGRFALVGVTGSTIPIGVVREKSNQVRGRLAELLETLSSGEESAIEDRDVPRSLREIAMERAAARALKAPEVAPTLDDSDEIAESVSRGLGNPKSESFSIEDIEEVTKEKDTFDLDMIAAEVDKVRAGSDEDEDEEFFIGRDKVAEEEVVAPDPVEVLEPIDTDESEIVIETEESEPEIESSPFEADTEDEELEPVVASPIVLEPGEPVESIFELELDSDEDEIPEAADPASAEDRIDQNVASIFEVDGDEEKEFIFEVADEEKSDDEDETFGSLFEIDSSSDEAQSEAEEDLSSTEAEDSDEKESGPLYF